MRQRIEIMGEAWPEHVTIRDDQSPCIVCGRGVNNTPPPWMIHVCNGGGWAHMDDDDHGELGLSGCLGMYAIGAACLRNHPELKPYAKRGDA